MKLKHIYLDDNLTFNLKGIFDISNFEISILILSFNNRKEKIIFSRNILIVRTILLKYLKIFS